MQRDLRLLLRYLLQYRRRYAAGGVYLLLTDAGQLVSPWILGRFADDYQFGRLDAGRIMHYVLVVTAVALVVAAGRYGWRMTVFAAGRQLEYDLRRRFFLHLERLSPRFFHAHKTGDLMAHATNDLLAVRAAAGEGVLMVLDAAFLGTFTLALMLIQVDVRLVLLGLVPLPLLALAANRISRATHERAMRVQAAFAHLSDLVQENVTGIRVVKAFVQEERQQAVFDQGNRHYVQSFLRMARTQSLIEPLITLLAGLGFFFVLGYGGSLVLRGDISLGNLVEMLAYLGTLIWPMIAVGWVVNIIQRGVASVGRIQAILDTRPEIDDAPDARPPECWRGAVTVTDLTFRYRDDLPPALQGISFDLSPGRTLGIIGRTGSGKSTLANLLVRLWDPPPGAICIDGRDVRDIPLAELREHVAYVPQDAFLFSASVADNIAFVPTAPDRTAIEAAAAMAHLDADIRDFSRGYDTMVGERGVTLSGGQRQRVGIARALLKQAPVLVLDDCLSAVDAATEARILHGLRPVMAERTTIIISHRVAAVAAADEILVLDAGRVVERGTHGDLLALGGHYARLQHLQQLQEEIAAAADHGPTPPEGEVTDHG